MVAVQMASALASLAYIGHGDTDCALVIANLLASLPLDPSTRDVRAVLVACIAVHPAFDANTVNTVRQALTKDLGTAPVPQRPELKIQVRYMPTCIACHASTHYTQHINKCIVLVGCCMCVYHVGDRLSLKYT